MTGWPLSPRPDNDSTPFWDAVGEGRLVARACIHCGHSWLPPRSVCPECSSTELGWRELSGQGTVFAVTVVERPLGPGFALRAPYAIAIVRLAEGPQMMGTLDRPAAIGATVSFRHQRTDDGMWVPLFEVQK